MTGNSTRMTFENGTGEALRITSAGDVNIGGNTSIASNGRVNIYRPTGTATNSALVINSDVGSTNSTQFIIQAGGSVGINTDNPERQLHIVGNDGPTGATLGNSDTCLILDNRQSNGAIMEFLSDNNGAGRIQFTDTDGTNRGRLEYLHSDDSMNFHTAGTERMSISSAGYVSGNINVPCWFGSQDTQHNVTTASWTTILNLGNSVVNPSFNNGGWNESTGIFTVQAGQAGYYFLYASAGIDDVQDADVVRVAFSKNDAAPIIFSEQRCMDQAANIIVPTGVMTQVVQLAVGDTIKAQVYHLSLIHI